MITDESVRIAGQLRKEDSISQAMNELWITQATVFSEWQGNSLKAEKEIGVPMAMEVI
jgi:hypothetical protein